MKNLQIETLRGLACVLLVAYHVVGSEPTGGLKVETGIYRELNDLLAYIRMPLFTFLSGWVYSLRPFEKGAISFVKSKARRLLLPMLTVGTLFAILQSITPGANSAVQDWTTIHIIPVAHFWFLEAIFTIFSFIVVLETLRALQNIRGYSIILALASIMFVAKIYQPIFALSGAIYLFPFFLLGMLHSRYITSSKIKAAAPWIYFTILAISLFTIDFNIEPSEKRSFIALIISASCCLLLQNLRIKSNFLGLIGRYSYSIFLFHVFFTAASRIFLHKVGIANVEILFFSGIIVGISGPVAVEIIVTRNRLLATLLLGKRLRQK